MTATVFDIYNRVWSVQRRGTRKLLLLALAKHADPLGICWASVPTLADLIGETPDYTSTLVIQAEQDGEILRKVGRGRGHVTIYGLTIGLDADQRQRLAMIVAATVIKRGERFLEIDKLLTPWRPGVEQRLFDLLEKEKRGSVVPLFGDGNVENPAGPEENPQPPVDLAPPPPPPESRRPASRPARRPAAEPEHVRWLRVEGGLATADDFRDCPDPTALVADFKARREEGWPVGAIVKHYRQYGTPTQETQYRGRQAQENQPERPPAPAARPAERRRAARPGDPGYYRR